MAKKQHVPDELQVSYDRLIELIPIPFRYEKHIQETILTYLKLKGEDFVRTGIEHTWKIFHDEYKKENFAEKNK